ncbi:MAG: hypothetical protein RMI89_12160 [Gloeomargarita sp. SKYBB_i_bin120]|nr:hypothetical protein [Gloeomargarita sp. SKYB120]MDW8179265.1 hypothetical protein [Gloeomargarita sp. SKYBB_i_bin120]
MAVLQARRGLESDQVALALFEVYFGPQNRQTLERNIQYYTGNERLGDWVSSLAQVGFQLCSDT